MPLHTFSSYRLASATAQSLVQVGTSLRSAGGAEAASLHVAEKYVEVSGRFHQRLCVSE